MKKITTFLAKALLLAFAASRIAALAAPDSGEPAGFEETKALAFVRDHPASDAELEPWLRQLGCPRGTLHDAIAARVDLMRKTLAAGALLDTEAFWGYYRQLAKQPGGGKSAPAAPALTTADLVSYARVRGQLGAGAAAGEGADALVNLLASATAAGKSGTGGGGQESAPTDTKEAAGDKSQAQSWSAQVLAGDLKATDVMDDLHFFLHTGLRTLAPYTIGTEPTTGKKRILSDSPRTNAFVEFLYSDVWAWRPDRVDETRAQDCGADLSDPAHPRYPPTGGSWFGLAEGDACATNSVFNPFRPNSVDFICRLGYDFGSDQGPSAATIAGSGAFSAELAVDQHLYRGWRAGSAYSLSLSAAYSGVSDGEAMRIHDRWLVGPSISVGFQDPLNEARRHGYLRAHFGRAWTDEIVLGALQSVPKTDTTPAFAFQEVIFNGDRPKFRDRETWGLQMQLCLPVAKQSFLTLGGSFYGPLETDDWNLQLGLTVAIAQLAQAMFK